MRSRQLQIQTLLFGQPQRLAISPFAFANHFDRSQLPVVFQQTAKQHRLVTDLVTQALQSARQLVECQIRIRADHIEIKRQLVHISPR